MRPGHCVGKLPLYLFQSLVGLGLPCIWGPVSRCDGNGGASRTGGSLHRPVHTNSQRRLKLLSPRGGGTECGPRTGRKTTAPAASETTAKYLPSPSYDLPLSKAPEKEWNLNIETLFWPQTILPFSRLNDGSISSCK